MSSTEIGHDAREHKKVIKNLPRIFGEVNKERVKQLTKWGVQNWPGIDQTLLHRKGSCTPQQMCEDYEIPTEERAQMVTDLKQDRGDLTYAQITIEELCEAVSEFDPQKQRYELIQTVAVLMGWIDCLDRHMMEMWVEKCDHCGQDHDSLWTLPMDDNTNKRYGICPETKKILYL